MPGGQETECGPARNRVFETVADWQGQGRAWAGPGLETVGGRFEPGQRAVMKRLPGGRAGGGESQETADCPAGRTTTVACGAADTNCRL